jgi:hypothetical protein
VSQSEANPNEPRDAAIDAAYRESAREAPPRALDDRILAAAHRAVAARPAPVRPDWTRRWRVPLSVAATLVLSATITLMVYESSDAPPPLAPARPQPSGDAQREAPRTELQMRERAAQSERLTEQKAAAPRPDERPAPEPQIAAAAGKPAAPHAAAPSVSPPVPFPADDRAKRSTPAQEELDQAVSFAKERTPAAPAATPPPPPPSATPRKREAESAATAAARRDATTANEGRALADQPAGRAGGVAPAPSPAPALIAVPDRMPAWTPPSGRALDLTAPEGWVEEIRWLKREGRDAEAAVWLTELKTRFPDYALPDDLR